MKRPLMTETPLTLCQGGAPVYHRLQPVSRSSFSCHWVSLTLALRRSSEAPLSPWGGIEWERFNLTHHHSTARQEPFPTLKVIENSAACSTSQQNSDQDR